MKRILVAAALIAGGALGWTAPVHAHGGTYRGPGDTVPPGGSGGGRGGGGPAVGPNGPSTPGNGAPTAVGPAVPGPGGSGGNSPFTSGGGSGPSTDLSQWSFWWGFNKEPYLNLKSHIHTNQAETGSDGFFLGVGQKPNSAMSLRPSDAQIRGSVVPALLAMLASETNNDIVTGCLIALAKIGDTTSDTGESEFEKAFVKWLPDRSQEISETAAIALGILANPASIETLRDLLFDTEKGRALVARKEVPYRTRAFAAYGLGLVGAAAGSDDERIRVVEQLARALQTDSTATRDVQVSCIIAMGLVPLGRIGSSGFPENTLDARAGRDASDENADGILIPSNRLEQLDLVSRFFEDTEENYLVRAHCPAALARLIEGLPARHYESMRASIVERLIVRLERSAKEQLPVKQSCVLALGLLGTNDGDNPTDKRIRKTLAQIPKNLKDQQSRYFSLIAMGQVGARTGANGDQGIEEASGYLLSQLARGKQQAQPWAGLACGVMGAGLAGHADVHPVLSTLKSSVRSALREGKDRSKTSAYAIASGMLRDEEAIEPLLELLRKSRDDETRGYIAVGLGLLNAKGAIIDINAMIEGARYRPDLLRQCAVALGLLGDKTIVAGLVEMLQEAKSLATQAAISNALGFIGDRDSIEPLIELLQNEDRSFSARGFAAAALGIVADKEPLPWNSKISVDLNYLAASSTLTQPGGTGVLDIL